MEYCSQHEPYIGRDHWQINMMFCDSPPCQIRVFFGVTSIGAELPRARLAKKAVLERLATSDRPLISPLTLGMRGF